MRRNALKAIWARGGAAINGWLDIGNSVTSEQLGTAGFDSLTVDMQHSLIDRGTAVTMLQALSLGATVPLVRVPVNDATEIGFALDAGACGIVCPLIETAADASRFVEACHYPPRGRRSWGPVRGVLYGGADYFAGSRSEIVTIALVETRTAIENLDAIARVPGLDAIYLGPNDLAISYGGTPSYLPSHPEVLAAMDRMLVVARDAGIVPAIHCGSVAMAQAMLGRGFRMVTLMSDTALLMQAATAAVQAVRETRDGGAP